MGKMDLGTHCIKNKLFEPLF